MPIVFIAHSKQAATWGADVGLGKNIFLLSTAATALDTRHVTPRMAGVPKDEVHR